MPGAENYDLDTIATHCRVSLRVHRCNFTIPALAIRLRRSVTGIIARTTARRVNLVVLAAQPARLAVVSNFLLQCLKLPLAFPFLLFLGWDYAFISKVQGERFWFDWPEVSERPLVFCVLVYLEEWVDMFLTLLRKDEVFTAGSHTGMKVKKNQLNVRGFILWS